MNQPFLLPGRDFGPASVQSPPPGRPTKWLRAVIVIWVLAGFAFVIWKLQPDAAQTPATPAGARTESVSVVAISMEDLVHHMDDVNRKLQGATERIRRTQEQISRALPSIERNYLLVEKQQLNTALASSEAARRELEESRQECELVLNSLRKEHQLQ